jgi:hypothetical protein
MFFRMLLHVAFDHVAQAQPVHMCRVCAGLGPPIIFGLDLKF